MKVTTTKHGYRLSWREATGDVHVRFPFAGALSTWIGHADSWLDAVFLADDLGF